MQWSWIKIQALIHTNKLQTGKLFRKYNALFKTISALPRNISTTPKQQFGICLLPMNFPWEYFLENLEENSYDCPSWAWRQIFSNVCLERNVAKSEACKRQAGGVAAAAQPCPGYTGAAATASLGTCGGKAAIRAKFRAFSCSVVEILCAIPRIPLARQAFLQHTKPPK